MTDTDAGSLKFIVIVEDPCDCGEQETRDILLRIFLDNDIQHRLHLSGNFFAQLYKKIEAVRKQASFCKLGNIEHGIICAICISSKEYFELHGIYYETN